MSIRTLAEIRGNLKSTTRVTQKDDMIDEFVNLTLQEINNPGWAMKGFAHNWSFNRRKHTFATVASTEFYVLPRDLDKVSLIRQTTSPTRLRYVRDDTFYRAIPDPTATGNPRFYRLWEEEGVAVRLATADTITIVSSSTSDDSSISVSVVGYDSDGIKRSESLSMNGTTDVDGAITFVADRPLRISKSADTTGKITVKETSGDTTLVILGEHERSPRFKVIGLYPIPSSAITMQLEYWTRIRRLEHAESVPDIDNKWIWLIRQGALAKVYQYQNKESDFTIAQSVFRNGVKAMVKADMSYPDEIPSLKKKGRAGPGILELSDEKFSVNF